MINSLLTSIPPELEEIWWMYDIILLVLIAVCVVLIVVTKRKSDKALAEKNLLNAVRILKKSGKCKKSVVRIRLFTVKNLLQTASYYYGKVIEEKDEFSLTDKIKKIKEINEACDTLIRSLEESTDAEINEKINAICSSVISVKEGL